MASTKKEFLSHAAMVCLIGCVLTTTVHAQVAGKSGRSDSLKPVNGEPESFSDKKVLSPATAAANEADFKNNWPALYAIAGDVIADVKRICTKTLSTDSGSRLLSDLIKQGTVDAAAQAATSGDKVVDREEFLRAVGGSSRTWGTTVSRKGEQYAVRVTVIPVHNSNGAGLTRASALAHVTAKYHDADSFFNRPKYLFDTMKATVVTSRQKVLYYDQKIGSYVFATQEMFATARADLECLFWPKARKAYGSDMFILLPSAAGTISHVALVTIYDDPERSSDEGSDTRNQHRVMLKQFRNDQ